MDHLVPLDKLKISGIFAPSYFRLCMQRHALALKHLWINVSPDKHNSALDLRVLQELPPLLLQDFTFPMVR